MRILVTRSPEDAERTAQRLAALGAEALIAPVTRIVPTGEPMPHEMPQESWDALIVTSAHALEALKTVEDKRIPVFAVGPHTASAVHDAGFSSVLVADGDAISLSALIRHALSPGLKLLHVTARHHKAEPATSLRAAGFSVAHWRAYEAQAVEALPPSAREALSAGQIDAALHYSRRSADIVLRLTQEAGLLAALKSVPQLCLSADVAAPFEALGIETMSASQPDEDSILALLERLP
ncbi:uroporphyrinogen-III synthase [Microvirga terricola]|uniref:Uroporphyrinogen-III synthase n=1 Tax=Microvirga terricola TaxID=2719797 RepID=A0ABX0V8L1_9HYPH|nr:uroporphyrinogen-III synthase [Microvirga terricola]NIX75321.1 uroporphyrinogen-III synthase [Microvirga terricola]